MSHLIAVIDRFSIAIGKAFGWCIIILAAATCYEVLVRYAFNAPTVWAFDMSVQMYGALFLMAGPYTLACGAHVRGDVFYRRLSTRRQAMLDLVLYCLFLIPGAVAMVYYGGDFAMRSWSYREVSWSSPARIQIYFFKTLIPIAGAILLLQGIAEILRCIECLRHGVWLPRIDHVKETEFALQSKQSSQNSNSASSS